VDQALDDPVQANLSGKVRAMLGVLRKMTLEPSALGADDLRPLRELGLEREDIRDAMYVAYLFNTYDRLADTLDWHVPVAAAFEATAKRLLERGYL
jgi:alkylhydroperoxidase family enzyme